MIGAEGYSVLYLIIFFSRYTQKDWSQLNSELKAIKGILNEVIDGSALKVKAKPASTSEPALDTSPQPPTHSGSKMGRGFQRRTLR